MQIAIIGSGISGLTVAHYLQRRHDVEVFEANDYVGGHTHTVDVSVAGVDYAIDTGFIVCNDRTYPRFLQLLSELGVARKPTTMSLSVRCDRSRMEYRGADLMGLFAQRRNLLRLDFWRMLLDIVRFQREAESLTDVPDDSLTVGDFFRRRSYSKAFLQRYFYPMGSAIWSCPMGTFEDFPLAFVLDFYRHHGLLSLRDRPQWYVIPQGSRTYVDRICEGLRHPVRVNCPITEIRRETMAVFLKSLDAPWQRFDAVVFACHSDQALKILGASASADERGILSAFPYEKNEAVLHTDTSLLPRRRRAWASWNYRVGERPGQKATVTYNMNILQGIKSKTTFCVTLNDTGRIAPARVLGRFEYSHPVFTTARSAARARHGQLLGHHRSYFCGAYWGNGFHEDGVVSGLSVCQAIERAGTCRAESTKVGSNTAGSPPPPTASATACS